MEVQITITAKFTPDGKMAITVTGPYDKPGIFNQLMEQATQFVRNNCFHNELKGGPGIVLAAPGTRLPPVNGG